MLVFTVTAFVHYEVCTRYSSDTGQASKLGNDEKEKDILTE